MAAPAGYGAGQPHASIGAYHDRESFVAAIAGAFGEASPPPAPVGQIWHRPATVAEEIETLFNPGDQGDGSPVPLSAAQRAAEEGGAALDLMKGHNSTARILIKTETYPTGGYRAVIRQVNLDQQDPVIVGGTPARTKRDRTEQERVKSSTDRTRKTIRQRCMSFKADRLLTLTYRENQTDRTRAYRDTVTFIARARAAGYLPRYVAVPEQQTRGAWHVHIACRGFMWVQTLRRIWRNIVGQDNGNIDLSYRHRGQSNPWRIASYLGKYIGKAIEQSTPGERTFWASEWSGEAPVTRLRLLPSGVTLTQVEAIVAAIFDRKRKSGQLQTVDRWHPRPTGADPPLTFVYWAI